jgi:hypothetical protein
MDNVGTIDFGAGSGNLVLSCVPRLAGNSLGRDDRHRGTKNFIPTNDSILQFDAALCRETYAYFPSNRAVAFAASVKPEINRPLFHVKPQQVCGRESKAKGRFGQRAGSQGKSSNSPVIYHAIGRLNLYLLSQDVRNRREHLYCQR